MGVLRYVAREDRGEKACGEPADTGAVLAPGQDQRSTQGNLGDARINDRIVLFQGYPIRNLGAKFFSCEGKMTDAGEDEPAAQEETGCGFYLSLVHFSCF